ncbi:DUF935 domain-containing protein [Jiella endophytica]|uniref:DUF935 domain-containing protein n=1 Tax=Jiella endophytica TaxID=2558362 RepID=A0A4Y8REV9_9HYPH|nr:DUF935 domain-containing protein [Jiella endophytica]TFF20529.1 DUF935 domain-containing protein [Jiella endophytica]
MVKAAIVRFQDRWGRSPEASSLGSEFATPQEWGPRRVIGDAVVSGLGPERLAAILRQSADGDTRSYLTLAMEMDERYLHYASQLQTRRLAIEGIPVTIEHDDKVPKKIVDAVNDLVEDTRFEEMAGTLTDAIGKGYAVSEIIWDYERGFLRPVDYRWRDQRFFQYDEATRTELRLRDNGDPRNGLALPAAKFLIHEPRTRMGLPIRRGMARPAAWAFLIQSFALKDWASFAEIYGVPLRVGKFGPNASEADKRILLQAVRAIANDAAAIIPAGMEMEFAKVEGQHGAGVFGGLIDYVDKQVSKLVLGQTMTSDDGSSKAQATVHNDVRLDIQMADGKQLGQTITRDLVVPFVALNFGPQELYPRAVYQVAAPEDLEGLKNYVTSLVPLGLKVSQREMRERGGLSEPEDGEELLRPATLPTEGGEKDKKPEGPAGDPAKGDASRTARLAAVGAPAGDAIDQAVAEVLGEEDWEPLVAPMIAGLEAKLSAAADLDEARAILAAHLAAMDPSALAEKLTQAVFAARIAGEAEEPLIDGGA